MAKQQLHNRWRTPILMELTCGIISFLVSLPTIINQSQQVISFSGSIHINDYSRITTGRLPSLLFIIVMGILIPAKTYVYFKMTQEPTADISYNDFLEGCTRWFKNLRATLWYVLWVCLWGCLFFIPGIIKSIAYLPMFLVIAEYPHISVRRAMTVSKVLTQGHKADLFVLFLSFIGWYLLLGIVLEIGKHFLLPVLGSTEQILSLLCSVLFSLWIAPYMSLSFANAYRALKEENFASKRLTEEDFIG